MKAEGRDETSAVQARLHPEAEMPDEDPVKERQLQRPHLASEDTWWLITKRTFNQKDSRRRWQSRKRKSRSVSRSGPIFQEPFY